MTLGAMLRDVGSRPEFLALERWIRRAMMASEGFVQSLRRGNIPSILWLLFAIGLAVLASTFLLQDERVSIYHLVPSGAMCATQEDMYDDTKRLCQMGNKFAYAYLLRHDWVLCAPNMPAARMLRASEDGYGNFWYGTSDRLEVRRPCSCRTQHFSRPIFSPASPSHDTPWGTGRVTTAGHDVPHRMPPWCF